MPGRTVTELERRYGRAGADVLDSAARRRRGSGAGSSRPTSIGSPASSACRAPTSTAPPPSTLTSRSTPRGRRHVQVCAGTACFAASGGAHLGAVAERARGAGSAASPTTATSRCSPSTASATATAGPAALDGEEPCAGPDLVDQLTGDGRAARSRRSRCTVDVAEPVVLAGRRRQRAGGVGGLGGRSSRRGDRDRVSREVKASGPARPRRRRLPGRGQVGRRRRRRRATALAT